jgi:hypothetical protein
MDFHSLARGGAAILVIAGSSLASPLHSSAYSYAVDFNLPIPAPDGPESEFGRGLMDDALIEIPEHLKIDDLIVRICLEHQALFDLSLVLISPSGTYVVLNPSFNTAFIIWEQDGGRTLLGGSGQWLFDDEAEVSIEEAGESIFGLLRPAEPLSLFDEEDAYGLWRLQINDMLYEHSGVLESYELIIATPEPATAIFFAFGAGLVSLCKPHRRR